MADGVRRTITGLKEEIKRLEAVLMALVRESPASPPEPKAGVPIPSATPATPPRPSSLGERIRGRMADSAPAPSPIGPLQTALNGGSDRRITLPRDFPTGRVTLGLDFGTHSTKLVLRARNQLQPQASVLFLDEPGKAHCPPFALPSLVRMSNNRLYFGRRALEMADGELFRSLKVDLLRQGVAERNSYPIGTNPDLLVAAYLAWVLGRVKDTLGSARTVFVNVPAPMDHAENPVLRARYETVVGAAYEATFGAESVAVGQGVDWAALRPRLEKLLEAGWDVNPVERDREAFYRIRPETLAPIVSRAQDPRWQGGMHLMADMGAGTTEFSVSLIRIIDGKPSIICYHDVTMELGGDRFEKNDFDHSALSAEHAVGERQLIEHLARGWRIAFNEGYSKDKNNGLAAIDLWRSLTVILTGGGFHRASLARAIEADRVPARFNLSSAPTPVEWHRPINLKAVGATGLPALDDRLPFLAVADGLSFEQWPKFSYPGEVQALARQQEENPFAHSYMRAED